MRRPTHVACSVAVPDVWRDRGGGVRVFRSPGEWTWSITQDAIRVPYLPCAEWDPDWRFTDAAGHEHHRAAEKPRFPTLKKKRTEPGWCDLCDDLHSDTYYRCRLCKEVIEPGTRLTPGGVALIPGMREGSIEGRSGKRILSGAEIEDVVARGHLAVEEIVADWPHGDMWVEVRIGEW
jgi:hypothetical protein